VTKLGEFPPIGRLFSFGRFLKITSVADIFEHFFKAVPIFLPKNGLGCILGAFSQTNLATLQRTNG
jgi:hypothetical protein